jgi:N-formylmaleamate deformylase
VNTSKEGEEYDMTEWFEGNVHANGITIQYHRTGGNNTPSILLLQGITDSGLCWSRVAHDLEGSYKVIMTDARGHGRSGGSATGFSLTLLAEDAAALIRALNLEKPFLFGHSMGAITAATVAALYPDLVRAIVLEDPPLVDKPLVQIDEEQHDQQAWPWLFDLRALPREERIARGLAMNPSWVEEEVNPWANSKAEFHTDVLSPHSQQFLTLHGARFCRASSAPFCSLRANLSSTRLSRPLLPRKRHSCGSVVRRYMSVVLVTISTAIAML